MAATLPLLAMLTACVLWSSSLVGNKFLLGHLAIAEAGLARLAVAAATAWLVVTLTGRLARLREIGWRQVAMGLLEPGMVTVLFLWGQSRTTAVNAASFWALMPIVMPILGRLVLGEALRPVHLAAAAIAVGGIALLLDGQSRHGAGDLLGDMFCIAGVLCGAANQLVGRRVAQRGGDPLATSAVQITTAALLMGAVLFLIERPSLRIGKAPGEVFIVLLVLGSVTSLGPLFLYNYALRHLAVARISLFPPLVGPIGASLAALFIGEAVGWRDAAAIAVILTGVFLPNLLHLARRALS
ncbi:DMT family transporter [Desertibaculum subflavum]|uniref:DMT family transporter n=1 Tax=Desertibaculum subflavum TaxID=2268458 RepID=UPI000E666D0F